MKDSEHSTDKPDPFFGLNPILDPKFGLSRVGPQGHKTGPIGSGWPQIGFKFGFNPIMYLINQSNLNPTHFVHLKTDNVDYLKKPL